MHHCLHHVARKPEPRNGTVNFPQSRNGPGFREGACKLPVADVRFWPGRAEAALKFVARKLTFAGMPRPSFRARREGPLMAASGRTKCSKAAYL